jgi:hypothetical protein
MHKDGEREKTKIRIRPSGGLYLDLAGCRGSKVLAGWEFSIPSGLWGVLAAGGWGPRGREFSEVAGGPAVRQAGFFPAMGIFVAVAFFFFNLKGIFVLCMMPHQLVKLSL